MIRNRILLIALIISPILMFAQDIKLPEKDRWKGFERVYHNVSGHVSWVVKPAFALPGKPWIWRASFPDWHPDMDSILLSRGFHLGYVSVDDQYGSPYALQVWDRFYQYATDSLYLSSRVALEAVSRGGLYAYGWAKRNPDKLTLIYAEAPVCDIKSWPGGKGAGKGSPENWKQLLGVLNMSEQQAMAYNENPIDDLQGLASFKVPIIHVIGIQDEIVPNQENTDLLVQRYTKLGGPALVYPVTMGPQELGGHHFPIEHPEWWADMIMANSMPVKKQLSYDDYFRIRDGLPHAMAHFNSKGTVTIAFLGGSITYNPGWRNKVCTWLSERYPGTRFRFIAAGIPSLGSLPHAFRLQQDVLDSGKVDLLFVEAAVNDKANGTDSITQIRSLEGVVRHARKSNPEMDIVLMSFADPDKNLDYASGRIPMEVANHERIAEHYGLPSINMAKQVRDRIDHHEFTWEYDFKDLHPSPFGQELYFATIKRLLEKCAETIPASATSGSSYKTPLDGSSLSNGTYYPITTAKADRSWKLDPDWIPSDDAGVRDGFVHRPMLVTATPGASLILPFNGTGVGISIISGPDAGMIRWSIDQGKVHQKDLFTTWSPSLHLPWYILFDAGLRKRKHILKLVVLSEKNKKSTGTACRIVHFLVNE
jgi:sialidase-1